MLKYLLKENPLMCGLDKGDCPPLLDESKLLGGLVVFSAAVAARRQWIISTGGLVLRL